MEGQWIKQQWNEALDLLYPRWCAGCGKWDEDLCARCREEFAGWVDVSAHLPYLSQVADELRPAFPVHALANYTGAVAAAIVSWKNMADRRMDRAFCDVISSHPPPKLPGTVVVPAPSSPHRSRQGRFVAGVIASAIADLYGLEVANVLRRPRGAALPRVLAGAAKIRPASMQARGRKAHGIRCIRADMRGQEVVLVDDVVTTGATLAGASRAVKSCGGLVRGAFVIAAAKDPRQMNTDAHTVT
ncbi:hypothetical protein CT171_01430 [Trueperella pyogenes]|uniref:ComF family protein n=1 Tax=Trueperella pyogenes TaxID=1661 RepID=UPI000C1B6D91|nr:phosphoribosyltransferase family protein [Trueperella pyogenes]PIN52316.1 hypothetical protein CT171_01430 [Trueperella pyogenes]